MVLYRLTICWAGDEFSGVGLQPGGYWELSATTTKTDRKLYTPGQALERHGEHYLKNHYPKIC